MTISTGTQLDAVTVALKDAAAKLADIFTQQAELKIELQAAANDADASGLTRFAEVFRDMAARLGSLNTPDGKVTGTASKRRGRPPKPADVQAPAT